MADPVKIFEVGPRDGLQNEARIIPTRDKITLVDLLSQSGLSKIEVTSFVSPAWVPQLADAADVMDGIARRGGVSYAALTPNLRGIARALPTRPDEVAVFGAASEAFSRKNLNCSISESLSRFEGVIGAARSAGIPVRGYVSCVIDCPYDGPTPPDSVARMVADLFEIGCYEVSLGDTTGTGIPERVEGMLRAVLGRAEAHRLAGHFHDTNGRAIENIGVALDNGLRVFDSSIAGLGGCPFAPGSKGNVATEDVVEFLNARGFETGIDLPRLATASRFARSLGGQQ